MNNFDKADQVAHPVETQWHYEIMTKAGFVALTKEAKGFVRAYVYEKDGVRVFCTTGVNSDHWSSSVGGAGFWDSLERHIKSLI